MYGRTGPDEARSRRARDETQEIAGVLPIFGPGTPLGNGPGFATATDPQTIAVTSPGPFAFLRPLTAHAAPHLWYSEHWSKEVW